MASNRKKPRHQANLSVSKTPNNIETPSNKKNPTIDPNNAPGSVKQKTPVWRMGLIDFDGYWGWGNLSSAESLKAIQEKLKNFETMTWGEIEKKTIGKGTPQNHNMPVNKICKEARNRLKEINLDDRDYLYSLRFAGIERLWGIREAEILYIVWWDKDHSVYPISY